MSHIVGIDLGTSNSVLSVVQAKSAEIIPNVEGSRISPSVVAFSEKDGILVGDLARRQSLINPKGTVYSIKRFMGKRFDELDESEIKSLPYEAAELLNGDAGVRVEGRVYSPQEISAHVLSKLKEQAERYLAGPVSEVVITVPAYFNDAARRATQTAGEIAGFKVRRIINEPTAAALAYGLNSKEEKLVAVYDFGGGTFDISILEIANDVIEVVASSGDSHLGGDDIDRRIMEQLISDFETETGLEIKNDSMVMQRLREAAERAKIEVSSMIQTEIHLPFLTADASGPKHLRTSLSRAQLENMIDALVSRSIDCCKRVFESAKLNPRDIDEVLLVGGTTRIPLVLRRVEEFFGKPANHSLNPDEVVAMGAAIQGAILSGDIHDLLLLDVSALSFGVEANSGLMVSIIERNTTIPVKKSRLFSTTVDNQTTVAIKVFQGERDFVAQNKFLGQFELTDIEEAPRGVPQIEVCFDIDANGVLKVSAKDIKSQKYKELILAGAGGLSEDEIRRAIFEAEEAREQDRAKRVLQEKRNRIQNLSFSISKMLREYSSSAPLDLLALSKKEIENADAVLANGDVGTDDLEEVILSLSALALRFREFISQRELNLEETQAQEGEEKEE